ncbi:MAG: PKD domain-containing protein, partial [Bacteroidota bacterium]
MKLTSIFFLAFLVPAVLFSQISFTADQTQGCYPMTVQFTNTSSTGTNFVWIFNDGTSYNGFETSHTFTSPGYYPVLLEGYDNSYNYLGNFYLDIEVNGIDTFYTGTGSQICPDE